MQGGTGVKQSKAIADRLAKIEPDQQRVLLATGRYIGEGFDDPRLDTLLLTLPISWHATIAQHVGRLHRLHEGKTEFRVYDYADLNVSMLSHIFDRRCQGFDQEVPKSAWAQVADTLEERLPWRSSGKRDRSSDDFIRSHARERLSSWIIHALEEAGEDQAATDFCIDEATNAGSYQRAVDRLVALRRYNEARDLAAEGLSNTDPSYAGLINQLQDSLAKIASENKDHSMAAAMAADRFVARPSVTSLQDLLKVARKAKCESPVEQVAMKFLETGVKPRFGS